MTADRCGRLGDFCWRRTLWSQLRNGNAVNGQKSPQASVLLAESNILLLWRFEWKRFRAVLGQALSPGLGVLTARFQENQQFARLVVEPNARQQMCDCAAGQAPNGVTASA